MYTEYIFISSECLTAMPQGLKVFLKITRLNRELERLNNFVNFPELSNHIIFFTISRVRFPIQIEDYKNVLIALW